MPHSINLTINDEDMARLMRAFALDISPTGTTPGKLTLPEWATANLLNLTDTILEDESFYTEIH